MQRLYYLGAFLVAFAQPAFAVSFTFSFLGNSGSITGLVDNTNNQTPATVQVTSSSASGAIRTYYYISGPGFNVSNGQVVSNGTQQTLYKSVPGGGQDFAGTYGGQTGANNFLGYQLLLGSPGAGAFPNSGWSALCLQNVACYSSSNGVLVYTASQSSSSSSVPGPLPLLGATAAFGWSRRLRKRLPLKPLKSL